jgi:hypothetical protein
MLGGSVGTSLLNTIFTSAVASYVTAHLTAARVIGRQALTELARHTATAPGSGGTPASSLAARSSAASCSAPGPLDQQGTPSQAHDGVPTAQAKTGMIPQFLMEVPAPA